MPAKSPRAPNKRCATPSPEPKRRAKKFSLVLPDQPHPIAVIVSDAGLIFRPRYAREVFRLTLCEAFRHAERLHLVQQSTPEAA